MDGQTEVANYLRRVLGYFPSDPRGATAVEFALVSAPLIAVVLAMLAGAPPLACFAVLGIGVLSVLFGIVMVVEPITAALALIWVIGSYAIAAGVIMIALAFKLKGHAKA